MMGGFYILPKSGRNPNVNFDWLGLIILGLLVTSLSYGINQIDTNNFMSSLLSVYIWPFLAFTMILLPILWKIERTVQDPLIPVDLFTGKEVKLVCSIMIGTGLVQASTVFIPAFVIAALFLSPSNASLMLIPIVMTMAVGAPIIGRLLDKFGSRNIMFIGAFTMVIGLFIVSTFSTSFYVFIFAGVLIGVGMSTAIGSPPRYIMLVESPPK